MNWFILVLISLKGTLSSFLDKLTIPEISIDVSIMSCRTCSADSIFLSGLYSISDLTKLRKDCFTTSIFVNNDGDLFAYGEALGGILPEVNTALDASGSPKRYRNLVGITLGTGFGGGFVSDGRLIIGDNSTAAEVWLFSNMYHPGVNAEDVVSTRSVQRVYANEAGIAYPNELTPKDIYQIANGEKTGARDAAIKAYAIALEHLPEGRSLSENHIG